MVIPYLDTLLTNIYSNFLGEAVKLVVLALIFHPALLPDDGHFSKHMVILSYQPLLMSLEKRTEVTFEEVTYSPLAIINKEELLGEWQVFKRAVFLEKKFIMKKTHQPSILAGRKTLWKKVLFGYFLKFLKYSTFFWHFQSELPRWNDHLVIYK